MPNRSLLANIHPETLQHAAANLRKTLNSESLLTSEPEQFLGRPPLVPSGGYREALPVDDPLVLHPTRETLHASSARPDASLPFNNGVGSPYSLTTTSTTKKLPTITPAGSSSNSKWTTSYGQPLYFSTPPSSNINNKSLNNNYSTYSSSSSSTTYYPPAQPQPPQATSTYSYSYSSSSNDNNIAPPDYAPPPPPSSSPPRDATPSTNYYSSYSSTKTTTNNSSSVPQGATNGHYQSPYVAQSNSANNSYSQSTSPYITNPQSYIHDFATKTPIAEVDPTILQQQQQQMRTTPVSARPKQPQQPASYAEELRNSTLTERQKYANQFQRSNLPERLPPQAVAHIYQETTADTERQLSQRRQEYPSTQASKVDEVDELIKNMEWKMRTGSSNDICSKCQKEIAGDTPGVTALGKPYHVTCFCCDQCQKQLAGCSFYSVDGKNLCQVDYMNSLDKCDKCATPITQKILRAMGKAFHPECFACPSCAKSLDGIPFTVDKDGTPFCLDCYHEKFSPRCAVCLKAIVPQAGETEVARIVAMDRSYHLACYKCEDCGLQLNSKIEGQGCYPLENHLFCKNCNLNRIKNKH